MLSEQAFILNANVTAADLLGVARDEMISKPLSRFVVREDQAILDVHLKHTFGTRVRQSCDLCLVKADGRALYARLESVAVDDSRVAAVRIRGRGQEMPDRAG